MENQAMATFGDGWLVALSCESHGKKVGGCGWGCSETVGRPHTVHTLQGSANHRQPDTAEQDACYQQGEQIQPLLLGTWVKCLRCLQEASWPQAPLG